MPPQVKMTWKVCAVKVLFFFFLLIDTQKSEGKLGNSEKFPLRLKGNHTAQHGILK